MGIKNIPHEIGAFTVFLGSFPNFETSSFVITTTPTSVSLAHASSTSGDGAALRRISFSLNKAPSTTFSMKGILRRSKSGAMFLYISLREYFQTGSKL